MAWTTRSGVRSGRAARTHAIAAETIGALKLVPDCREYPSWALSGSGNAGGTAVRMSTPGALRSIASLEFEKSALLSSRVVAATVTTCGSEAGNSSGLPSSNSLPAAATGMIPLATAK